MSNDSSPGLDEQAREILGYSRWWQIVAATLMMGLVGPYQFVWTSINGPLAARLDIAPAAIGSVFALYVLFQAGTQFPVGWYRDRHGPRALTIFAAVLAGGGYFGLSHATSVWQIYAVYSVGSIGVGIVYTVAINTALKWFPDRQGLTVGLGTMAFAGGSSLIIPYVRSNATVAGYPDVLRNIALLIGVGIFVAAFVLQDPPQRWMDDEADAEPDEDPAEPERATQYGWRAMLRTWQFWVMYVMFVAVSGAGLLLTANVVAFAESFGLTATITTAAATLLPVSGGVGRLLMGGVSDRYDRESIMAVSFIVCGAALLVAVGSGHGGLSLIFVGAITAATFFWSPQFALFPSLVADYFGTRNSSANYALLYSGKVWGGLFGGTVAGWVVTATDWSTAFSIGGALAILAGVLAIILRPPADGRRD